MRLFIGIFPSKQFLDYYRDVWREFAKEKRNLRLIDLEQIHLTMRFIGPDVQVGSKNQIADALLAQSGQYPKPEIKVEKLQFGFPRQHDPRVLMAQIERNHELDELTNKIHKTIRQVNRRDTIVWKTQLDKQYHMSLARLKQSATRSTGRDVKDILKSLEIPAPEPFVADEMYLVQSTITPRGPVYKKLEKIRL